MEKAGFVIKTLLGLEPGGYIQWDEMDVNTMRVQAPNQMTTTDSTIKFLAIWKELWKNLGIDFGFATYISLFSSSHSPLPLNWTHYNYYLKSYDVN